MGGSNSKIEKAWDIKTKWFHEYVKTNLLTPTPDDATKNTFTGKTIAITGCTSGTGYVLAETCVKNGVGTLIMLNRSSERSDSAQQKLQDIATESKSTSSIDSIPCDLQDFTSVRSAIDTIKSKYDSIDVLCNNGGVMALEDVATKDGYDVQMQTNHLSHFLLTKELFPLLKKAVELRGEARVINHSSIAREGGPLEAKYFEKNGNGNLGGNGSGIFFTGARWDRYHQTKLANAAFTLELSKRIDSAGPTCKGIKAVVAAPGVAATNLQVTTSADGGMSSLTNKLIWPIMQSAEDGTMPLLAACFDPRIANGDFWEPSRMGGKNGPPSKINYDKNSVDDKQRTMLWTKSEEACGEFKVE
jgi:NAD(P)-dependent dehydrogenase (short-subunit alcohol dehydrogenase family)